ncbi:MAG: DUF2867 domain-containing protein [Bacteroidota bacterium]
MKTYQLPLPEKSIIQDALQRIDYEDTFAMQVEDHLPVEQMPGLFFKSFPKWFLMLMGIREILGKLIGLKTAHGIDVKNQIQNFKGEVGESIALFHVMGRSAEELMMGENDSHLDFRLSFFSRPNGGKTEIAATTTVQFNNQVGRIYFLPVKPIHRLIMPIILKRMYREWKGRGHTVEPTIG